MADVNAVDLPDLRLGQSVQVTLSSDDNYKRTVPAKIDQVLKTSHNRRRITIFLGQEELNLRDFNFQSRHLNGLKTDASAQISVARQSAWVSIKNIFGNILENRGIELFTEA